MKSSSKTRLIKSVTEKIYDLICSGGGNNETIKEAAEKIVATLSRSKKNRIERFEAAVRVHEMMGGYPPNEWETIQKEYEAAKAALIQ